MIKTSIIKELEEKSSNLETFKRASGITISRTASAENASKKDFTSNFSLACKRTTNVMERVSKFMKTEQSSRECSKITGSSNLKISNTPMVKRSKVQMIHFSTLNISTIDPKIVMIHYLSFIERITFEEPVKFKFNLFLYDI